MSEILNIGQNKRNELIPNVAVDLPRQRGLNAQQNIVGRENPQLYSATAYFSSPVTTGGGQVVFTEYDTAFFGMRGVNGAINIEKSGTYLVIASIQVSSPSSSPQVNIVKNGTTEVARAGQFSATPLTMPTNIWYNVSTVRYLKSGEYITATVSGANVSGDERTFLQVQQLS